MGGVYELLPAVHHMGPLIVLALSLFVPLTQGSVSTQLAQVQVDFYAFIMSEYPLFATDSFVHKHDDQLYSYSLSRFPQRKSKVMDLMERLQSITKEDLRGEEAVSYSVLEDMLNTFINGYKWRSYQHLNPVTFLEGPQQFLDYTIQNLPFFTPGDYENYLTRLHRTPTQYAEIEERMREAIALNRTNHFHSMSRVEQQFKSLMVPANQSAFYWPFLDTLQELNFSSAKMQDLQARGLEAVKGVMSALEDLWQFIENVYLPNTRPEIGISSLDGGMEFYQACIRWYLSVDMDVQTIHETGLREVERIATNMQRVMKRQGFQGSIGEYFRSLMNDSRFFFKTGEELLEEYRSQINDVINPRIDEFFSNNPQLPIEVRALSYDEIGGYYTPGTADGTRPGVFWVNAFRPQDIANFTMMALSLHESNPGHHLQISIERSSNLPNFRRNLRYAASWEVPLAFPDYTAMAEGWALYAEFLGEEMGLYRDDYELMGRYSSEIFRACRLVVDTGIHAFGWSRDQSISYFLNYTAETYDSIAIEIDRYITIPGQALAYKIGELKIKELREKAERQLGSRFDLKEFHEVVLEGGTLPLHVLELAVDTWLQSYPDPPVDTPIVACTSCRLSAAYWSVLLVCSLKLMY